MPPSRRRPTPPERLTELLVEAKRAGVDFDDAWAGALARMRRERAWPHATQPRHDWRAAVLASESEYRAAYLGIETPFMRVHVFITAAIGGEGVVSETPAELIA